MKIAIGGDHAGFIYKEQLKKYLTSLNHEVTDFGPLTPDTVDYPDFVHPLAESIKKNLSDFGILICGSGQGVSITANKHEGIRAALAWNAEVAQLSRQHNDANVICLPARFIAYDIAERLVLLFLETEFEAGRHLRRVNKINC
jgi:ribose 5-phosphate isomerase B|tara:strand:+ start:540 stop:968 length:429 start_codon:yes stop_codon:yes gene_type:complete